MEGMQARPDSKRRGEQTRMLVAPGDFPESQTCVGYHDDMGFLIPGVAAGGMP